MDLNEIKTELEKLGKSDMLEAISTLINTEKQKGIDEVSKRNKENQSLRRYKIALETAGLTEDDDVSEFLAGKVKKENNSDSLTLKSLKSELDRVKAERDNERLNGKRKTLQAELTSALGDKVYGAKFLIQSLINDGTVDILDGEVVFKKGDEHVDFQTGVKQTLDANKDILKTTQAGGSGTSGSQKVNKDIQSILSSNDPVAIKANLKECAEAIGLKI